MCVGVVALCYCSSYEAEEDMRGVVQCISLIVIRQ
jgi:hypothetical protein